MSVHPPLVGLACLVGACGGKAHYQPPGSAPDAAVPDAEIDASADAAEPCTVDGDEDRSLSPACGGRDCDDADPSIHPGADDPGEWVAETVDGRGWALHPTIAVDAAGVVHIAWEDLSTRAVRHAVRSAEDPPAWTSEIVEAGGRDPVLVADTSVRVVYAAPGGLRLAALADGLWTPDDAVGSREDHRLRLPSAAAAGGVLFVAWLDDGPEGSTVGAARFDGATWEESSLPRDGLSDPADDGPPALAVDPGGRVHVVFTSGGSLFRAQDDGGGWSVELLAIEGALPAEPQLAFDSGGTARIAYHDGATASLVLARQAEEGFSTVTVDDRDDPGAASALALDAAGAAHLLYFAAGTFDVRYATDAFGEWIFQTLDRHGEAGTAIAIDAEGILQMGYATTDSDLQYTRHVGGDGIDQDCSGKIDG